MSSLSFATYPKDTLTAKGVVLTPASGTGSKSTGTFTIMKRYYTEPECLAEKALLNAQKTMVIGPNNITAEVTFEAKCEALNHSIYQ